MRIRASSPCNDIAMTTSPRDASILVRDFGNSLDVMPMDLGCVSNIFLSAGTYGLVRKLRFSWDHCEHTVIGRHGSTVEPVEVRH